MKFIKQEINRRLNWKWHFKLFYQDKDGYKTVVEKEGLRSKTEAEKLAGYRKRKIKKEWKFQN